MDRISRYIVNLSLLLICLVAYTQQQKPVGFELPPIPSYVILAPQKVRPNQILKTSVTILRMVYPQVTIRLAIKMNDTEFANSVEEFNTVGTRIMQIEMPRNTVPGDYYLHVDGSIYPNSGMLFSNRTRIEYDSKQISIFIQMSKPVYHQSQVVRFRVIPVEPNLMPVFGTLMAVEVVDATGTMVRRWLNPMTNAGGIIELDFVLADQISEGKWKIRARHEKFVHEKEFYVEEYWVPRFDVNVTMPSRLTEHGFGVYGLIQANHTTNKPVKGNMSLVMELRDPNQDRFTTEPLLTIKRQVQVFEGKSDFMVTMAELKKGLNDASLADKEVWVNVTVNDWFFSIERQGWAYGYIYSAVTKIQFLGDFVRPFKPDMYFTAYMVVFQPDGTKVYYTHNRYIAITIYCNDNTFEKKENGLPIPDDGVVQYTFKPSGKCVNYRLHAQYMDELDRVLADAEQYIFRYHSESNTYMQVTTSTLHPRVDDYMVFNVQTNYPTNAIFYQIAAGGNIVYTDKLSIPNAVLSRTFSVAISRDMAPIARMIVFFVKQDGEIVSDSLTFYASIDKLNYISATVNRGKDLNVDIIEVIGRGNPGAFIAFSAIHYDLYLHGGASILRDFDLIDELYSYESHAQAPFQHTWYHDLEDIERVYFPSQSMGADTNTTMNTSGLLLFTDANFTKVNFYHTCNETENQARALPCFSIGTGQECYARSQRCDGVPQCLTKVDELGCKQNKTETKAKNLIDVFHRLYWHWNDGDWMWKTQFIKPDGLIEFFVPLPKIDTSWVMGVFSVDREHGFSILPNPAKFSGVRRFFITMEMPETAAWGEQIGVRVAVFNYWNYWVEALVEVKRSSDYKIVQVGWGGATTHYSPNVITDQTVQTLTYLEAGQAKYVHVPILPHKPGNATITVCAYTFIGSNCETRTIKVHMNGVTNYYHTAIFLDMTASSTLFATNLKIVVPQMFVEQEKRQHRYVPGSPHAAVSVVGDVIGPSLSNDLPFVTTEDVLRLSYGTAENVAFELGYNIQLMNYLLETGYLPNDVRNRGLAYCNTVLQRIMSYYNPTSGAFANFRDSRDIPSVLATVQTVWNLLETRVAEWDRLIFVPENLLIANLKFLDAQQEKTPGMLMGSFSALEAMDRRFRPVIDEKKHPDPMVRMAHSRVPITAMVVIALRVTHKPPSGVAADTADSVVSRASQFLRQYLVQLDDVFSMTIGTYALELTSSSGSSDDVTEALKKIKAKGYTAEYFYLANYPIPMPRSETSQAGVKIDNPRQEWPNDGYGVATSAMYFSLMMRRNMWQPEGKEAMDMVIWLASMRNHVAGFASTFDSLMAMSSLRRYASLDKNRQLYKLAVLEKLTSVASWQRKVEIRTHNYSTVSVATVKPYDVWGEVFMQADGMGRLLLQLDVSVNVEYSNLLKTPYNPADATQIYPSFLATCNATFGGRNYSIMYMRACTQWVGNVGPLPLPQSGMAVFEIALPSGYVSMNDELRRYVLSKQVPNLRYARWRPGKIHFFFDTITTQETCVMFRADRFMPVANMTREHLCSVYEYYEPGRYNNSLYWVTALYTNHICNVCGSYQCPYCPDFNTARAAARMSAPLIVLACVLAFMKYYWRPSATLNVLT